MARGSALGGPGRVNSVLRSERPRRRRRPQPSASRPKNNKNISPQIRCAGIEADTKDRKKFNGVEIKQGSRALKRSGCLNVSSRSPAWPRALYHHSTRSSTRRPAAARKASSFSPTWSHTRFIVSVTPHAHDAQDIRGAPSHTLRFGIAALAMPSVPRVQKCRRESILLFSYQ